MVLRKMQENNNNDNTNAQTKRKRPIIDRSEDKEKLAETGCMGEIAAPS
jgi:hypothetical protein